MVKKLKRLKERLRKLPRMSDAKLEARGLAAGQSPHLANETDELDGRREHGVA